MSWHILIYTFVDVNDELENWSIRDIGKLTDSKNPHQVIISMLVDTTNLGSYLISITGDPYQKGNMEMRRIPNQNMSDPQTLKRFVFESIDTHPADRYCLVLQGHGSGWFLRTEKDSIMSIAVLADTLKKTQVCFDIICFDNCMMANLETIYTMRDVANYIIAYEDYAGMNGFAQPTTADFFDKNQSTLQICLKIANNLMNSLSDQDDPTDVSVFCLRSINNLAKFLSDKTLCRPKDNSFCIEPNYWHLQDLYSIVERSPIDQNEFKKLFSSALLYYSQSVNKNKLFHHGLSCIVDPDDDTYDLDKTHQLLDIHLKFN